MAYYDHPAYNDALCQAASIARRYPIDSKAGARVWYDPSNDKMGVAAREDPNYSNDKLETVAYAQLWSAKTNTVQLRFAGAWSEWV